MKRVPELQDKYATALRVVGYPDGVTYRGVPAQDRQLLALSGCESITRARVMAQVS